VPEERPDAEADLHALVLPAVSTDGDVTIDAAGGEISAVVHVPVTQPNPVRREPEDAPAEPENAPGLGSDRPDALAARASLASERGLAGDAAAARDEFAALVPVVERVLGPEHPDALAIRNERAYWIGQAGDAAAARDEFAALVPVVERVLGPEHPDTLASRASLAYWTGQAGELAAARDEFAALVPVVERVLGPEHPDTLITRHHLANFAGYAGDPAAARDRFAALVPARVSASGPDHPDTLAARFNFAYWTGRAGDAGQARALFADLLPVRERVSGPDHADSLAVREELAYWTGRAGDPDGARDQFAALLPARERVLGPEHPDTLAVRHQLAYWTGAGGEPGRRPGPVRGAAASDPARRVLPVGFRLPAAGSARRTLPVGFHVPAAGCARRVLPVGFGLPAADSARRVLAVGFRQPRADPAGRLLPHSVARPSDGPSNHSPPSQVRDPVPTDDQQPLHGPHLGPRSDSVLASPAPEETQGSDHQASRAPAPDRESAATRDQEPEPSGLERRRDMADRSGGRPVRTRMRVAVMAAAGLILLAASGVVFALSGQHGAASAAGALNTARNKHAATAAVQMAAEWVSQQVSHSAIVACDPQMCSALEARGMPAANLLILRTSTASLLGAEVVVATPAVRSQLGSRLDSVYAPLVIAGFGSAPVRVNVQVIAPGGAAAYLMALRQDIAARQAAGTELLANKRISATAEARMQLAAGEVDSRLLIMLAALAAIHPVQILDFGDPGPGASPGVPLCSADLSSSGRAAGMTDATYLHWLVAFISTQLVPFAGSTVIVRQGDQPVIRVEFSRPSPLGLLSHR
jgi:Tetratricopeptide repeat